MILIKYIILSKRFDKVVNLDKIVSKEMMDMEMMQKHKLLRFVRIIALVGCSIGALILLFGLFATGYNENHVLTFTGIGIIVNSMTVFGAGLFFAIVDELIGKQRRRVKL